MIIRRITEGLKQQHWTSVSVELVILVLGVYIGLQAQEWSKQREDRQAEIQIIADFLADLEQDRADFAAGMEAGERAINAANTSLTGAGLSPIEFDWNITVTYNYSPDNAKAIDLPASRPDRLWTDVVLGFFPTPNTATYEALVGSGDFKIIRDRNIVRQIQIYHSSTDTVVVQNSKLMSIREHTLFTGAAYGLAPYVEMPAKDYFQLIASKPPLAAAIRIQATFTIFHHGEIKVADERATELQDHLRDYLEATK
jgi:hypothetical protein